MTTEQEIVKKSRRKKLSALAARNADKFKISRTQLNRLCFDQPNTTEEALDELEKIGC